MTAQGEDLLAWLDRAITAREQAAQDAARAYGSRWVRPVDTDMVRVSEDGTVWFQALSDEIAEHVVYNSPESVLRRCAADRKLIGQHGPWNARDRACRGCGLDNHDEQLTADYADCPVLNGIAEGYGWTEGQR